VNAIAADTTMTSRERLLCALRCGAPDRVPAGSFGLGRLDIDSEFTAEFIAATDSIHSPGCGFGFWGSAPDLERADEGGGVTRVTLHGPKGDLVWRHRRTAETSACVEFPAETSADIERVLSVPYTPCEPTISDYRRDLERFGDELLVMPGIPNAVCWVAELFSPEDFSLLWAEDPKAMAELCAVGNERLVPFTREAARLGIEAFRIVGGEYVTCQLGPRGVEPLLSAFDGPLCDAIHEFDAIAYYHCHGPIMRFLSDLRDLGIDALDPLEAPPFADCDLVKAKEILGGRVCIVGNLDDMEQLERLDADTVRRIARERIRQAGPDGYILGGTASGTFTERGARNFMVLREVAEEYADDPQGAPGS